MEGDNFLGIKIFASIYGLLLLLIYLWERILTIKILKASERSKLVFYRSIRSNLLLAYFLLVYFSDREAVKWLFDIFIYTMHFTLFTTFGWIKAVLDNHCKYEIENQVSYDQLAEYKKKMNKIKVYFKALHSVQIIFLVISVYFFSEVEFTRLYCLYIPGFRTLFKWLISYEEKFARYKDASIANEKLFTNSFNYWFGLKTASFLLLSGAYLIIFTKTGFSIVFSLAHLFYMNYNFKFVIVWAKELERFKIFHKYRRIITKNFPLKEFENQKEEWPIWLTYLVKARKLSCGHCFHLICLLQLVKNGDK